MNITNWTELLSVIPDPAYGAIQKLLVRINQSIRSYQKSDETFNLSVVKKNHQDIFNNFKLTYEQLLIEDDIIDIFAEVPSLSTSVSKASATFNMIGVGKWIKFHGGNASRIFFFDEEKTMISDKSMADFLNKIEDLKSKYFYFGAPPQIYYKFKTMPSDDIVQYLSKFGVECMELDSKTPAVEYRKEFTNKVLVDQSMMLTLCSNISHGYFENNNNNRDAETMVKNRLELESTLSDKIILVNNHTYEQTKYKVNKLGDVNEKERFEQLSKKITIVPDAQNPRFYYLKDMELMSVSVAEREYAILITGNQRLCHKLDAYYPEIPYKHFIGAQLQPK